ncbi:hypothetical protein OSTOST_01735 [Ostertagia ostertagi]
MEEQFNRRHGSRRRCFDVDDAVYARDYRGPKDTWTPQITVERLGNATPTSYEENVTAASKRPRKKKKSKRDKKKKMRQGESASAWRTTYQEHISRSSFSG